MITILALFAGALLGWVIQAGVRTARIFRAMADEQAIESLARALYRADVLANEYEITPAPFESSPWRETCERHARTVLGILAADSPERT